MDKDPRSAQNICIFNVLRLPLPPVPDPLFGSPAQGADTFFSTLLVRDRYHSESG